ncbi:MAG TPA: hydroxyisourate hydrolase [Vicinamibacterales bacterium]|nr:hydroxyisourate hydrolase [Vicinamibacterales bacterium]
MSAITTHVLDTARGVPAAGVSVVLERQHEEEWHVIGRGQTDADGRQRALMPEAGSAPPGVYRLRFDTGAYFEALSLPTFFPQVTVTFEIPDGEAHHHVPLLLSPYGYTTYRGS